MTVSSADPDKLRDFVTRSRPARTTVATDRSAVANLQSSVRANSPDFGVDVPGISALATLLESLATNETFVSTIRDELLAADSSYSGGTITVSDAAIVAALDAAGVGTPPPALTFEPASMFGLPPTSGFVDDPICAANGNMIHQEHDLDIPGHARSLSLVRTYNSLLTDRSGAFGPGWSSLLDVSLRAGEDRVEIDLPDGATAAFVRDGEGWSSFGRRLHSLARTDDGGWTVATDRRRAYHFDGEGSLRGWTVGTASISVTREQGRVVAAGEQTSGREWIVEWSGGVVVSLLTNDGRRVRYEYDDGTLVRVVGEGGHVAYGWDRGLLVSVTDADGVRSFLNEYDDTGRVVRQTSPFGRVTAYRYDPSGLTVITDERGVRQAMVHDARGNLTSVIDVDGTAMRLSYDHLDRVVQVDDRNGAVWRYRYDTARDELVERQDPDGLTAAWEWDEDGRLLATTDRRGATTRYEYTGQLSTPSRIIDPAGAVTTIDVDPRLDQPARVIDADGVVTVIETDADGQVTAVVDALGHRTEVVYDAAGRPVRGVDALRVATELEYDDRGWMIRAERAGRVSTYARTPAGRVRGGSEPGGQAWSAEFGPHGAPIGITDALGNTVGLEYDAMGNVVALTAPDGARCEQRFDAVGRLVAVTDPSGATTTQRYDRAGHLVAIEDAEGHVAHRDVDLFGRTVRSTAADGRTSTYTYHPNGEVATLTTPDGRTWTTELDAIGRVVAVVDPAGGRAEVAFSAAGRLVERRSPAGRVERFEHDVTGRLIATVDPRGVRRELSRDAIGRVDAVSRGGAAADSRTITWDEQGNIAGVSTARGSVAFEHDVAGRLLASVDGSGVRTEFEWDARGLLVGAVDPAGGRIGYEYDARGRVTSQTTPGGRTTSWGYDAAGRAATITDPVGMTTRLTRDRAGRLIGLDRGDAGWRRRLDEVGRELERTDLAGDPLAGYRYDDAGRLAEASAPNGLFSTFLWDTGDRITTVTDATGTTTIERDADGWAVAMTQPTGLRTRFERDGVGRIVRVVDDEAGELRLPVDPVEFDPAGRLLLGPDGTVYRYDDAGRLAEVVPPSGATTTYQYGADGLLLSERGELVRHFGYDAAGRVATIAVDGVGETEITYDDAGRRAREIGPDGTTTTYRWVGLDQLVGIVRTDPGGRTTSVTIDVDALGRPARVNGQAIGYDPTSGLPSRIGDVRIVNLPAPAHGSVAWRSDDRVWGRQGAEATHGLKLGPLTMLGARVHDSLTHQFLSADPLGVVPGSNGAASAYTYAWQDPVNFVDPSGMRPISQEEWDGIRTLEEQGRVGQMVQAIKDDPWGSLVAGAIIVGGVVLLATPLAPIGAGILIGAGMSAGMGLATGTFDPRQVALGGVVGGLTAGVGSYVSSTTLTVAAGVGIGAGNELGNQIISGQPIDWQSVAVNGLVNGATLGVGGRLQTSASSMRQAVTYGALTDGAGNLVTQRLTGDGSIDMTSLVAATAGGGAMGGSEHYFAGAHQQLEVPPAQLALEAGPQRLALPPGPGPDMITVYRGTSIGIEQQIHGETGLMLSDAAREAYMGTGGDLDIAHSYSMSAHQRAVDIWGSENDYVQAHSAFGHDISDVSGTRTMVSVTTDPDVAQHFAGKDGIVYRAEVPADSVIRQTLEGAGESEYLAPHSIRMDPAPTP